MRKKSKLLAMTLVLAITLGQISTQLTWASPAPVNLTDTQGSTLEAFFQMFVGENYVGIYLNDYDVRVPNSAHTALAFVLWYGVYVEGRGGRLSPEDYGMEDGVEFLSARHVEAALRQHFTIAQLAHHSIAGFTYAGGRYTVPIANGGAYARELDILALYDNEDGTLSARIHIATYFEGQARGQQYNIAVIQPTATGYQMLYWRNDVARNAAIPVVGNVMLPESPPVEAPITIPASNWAVNDILRATELGIVPGVFQGRYTQNITRAEFAALVVTVYERLTGQAIEGRVTFTDTNDINVEKAAYIGIITGVGNNQFYPHMPFNREQAAVMVSRLADALGRPFPPGAATFGDNGQISTWAIDHVGQALGAGIMSGVGNNMFNPQGVFTIEQSIVTMLRVYDALGE